MNEISCPHCGQTHATGVRFCPNIGRPIQGAQTCPHCGEKVEAHWEVCAYCGLPLKGQNYRLPGIRPAQWIFILALVGFVAFGGDWLLTSGTPTTIPETTRAQTQGQGTLPTSTSKAPNPLLIPLATQETTITSAAQTEEAWVVTETPETPGETLGTSISQLLILPRSQPKTSNNVQGCEKDKWSIIPTGIQAFPTTDGFKFIVVPYSLENNSPYWGDIRIDTAYVQTEGGFIYRLEAKYKDFVSYLPPSSIGSRQFFPPGFSLSGDDFRGPYMFIFKVAESQNHFTIFVKNTVKCFVNGDIFSASELSTPYTALDLDIDIRRPQHPTYRPDSEFANITDGIVVPNKGTFELMEIGGNLTIKFLLANASPGYETTGRFAGYLVGGNGFMYHSSSYTGFRVGPGQTAEVVLNFAIPSEEENFKLVWITEGAILTNADLRSKEPKYGQVFNIPDK